MSVAAQNGAQTTIKGQTRVSSPLLCLVLLRSLRSLRLNRLGFMGHTPAIDTHTTWFFVHE